MHAEIITIGDEILIGQTVDTNSAWLAEQLHLTGVRLRRITSIADERDAIRDSLDEAFSRVDLVIITGGLGPTQDDITKQSLAEYFGTRLVRNSEVLGRIEAFFESRGAVILEANRQQADLPEKAKLLMNSRGSAMGMWFEKGNKVLISLPGVPHEMKGIMTDHGLEHITRHFDTRKIIHKTLLTQGIGESFLAETLSDWETSLRDEGIFLAYLPSPGKVRLRLTAYPEKGRESVMEEKMERYVEEATRRLPLHVFGRDKETLAEVIGRLLRAQDQTLATAESCTGGFLSHLITAVPGSSDYFVGGVITYSNTSKENVLGVSVDTLKEYGAVSENVAREMAEGCLRKLQADYAIATTGVAGPEGGSDDNPAGTVWIAIASSDKTYTKRFQFGHNRERNIRITALTALNALRNEFLSEGFENLK